MPRQDLVPIGDVLPRAVTLGYPTEVRQEVLQPLVSMIEDMQAAGLQPQIQSGFRSYIAQALAWEKWNRLYPERAAIISAPPGHSEHQLGTVVDFGSPELAGLVGEPGIEFHTDFAKTSEGMWLAEHAHDYGFTLSYTLDTFEISGFYLRTVAFSLCRARDWPPSYVSWGRPLRNTNWNMNPRPASRRAFRSTAVTLLLLLLTACQPAGQAALILTQPAPKLTAPAPSPSPPSPTAAAARPSPLPATAQPAPIPATAVPTALPTPTVRPLLSLSVPQQWWVTAQTAVSAANADPDAAVTWQVSRSATADVHLQHEVQEGLLVAQMPLVLAVPFTLDWEEVTWAEAQAIVDFGNEQVTLLPWSELDASLKSLRIDGRGPADPAYPLQETWSLAARPEYQESLAQLLPHLRAAWPRPPVHLLAVGDLMLDRRLGEALQQGDIEYPFAEVAETLRAADITVGNLESALGEGGEPEDKRYPFRAPVEAAAALGLAGFDVLSLANNHAMDYGPETLLAAIELLRAENVAAVGAGANAAAAHAPLIIEQDGLTIAFLSYVNVPVEASSGFDTAVWTATENSPGLAWADPQAHTSRSRRAERGHRCNYRAAAQRDRIPGRAGRSAAGSGVCRHRCRSGPCHRASHPHSAGD